LTSPRCVRPAPGAARRRRAGVLRQQRLFLHAGLSAAHRAAVRYWVYARAALTARQIANITIVVSLTFWLGMASVFGLGLFFAAEPLAAIDHLPPLANFLLGAAILGSLGYYCVWASLACRSLRLWGRVIALPGARTALLQLALGVLDIGCAAAALHALLPLESQSLDFAAFAAIYVFAALVGRSATRRAASAFSRR